MAATIPARRVAAPRPRATGKVGPQRHTTETPTPRARPELRIVPKPRAAVNAALVLGFVVVALMLGTVVLHTRLAERQVQIDRLEQQVEASRARFDVLRQQRAELRSPTRLAIEAQRLGMMPAPSTEFLTVDPHTVAEALAAAGVVDETTGTLDRSDPLEQVRRVKAANQAAG